MEALLRELVDKMAESNPEIQEHLANKDRIVNEEPEIARALGAIANAILNNNMETMIAAGAAIQVIERLTVRILELEENQRKFMARFEELLNESP